MGYDMYSVISSRTKAWLASLSLVSNTIQQVDITLQILETELSLNNTSIISVLVSVHIIQGNLYYTDQL